MSASDNIEIICVAPAMLDDVWPRASRWVGEGIAAAEMDPIEVIQSLVAERRLLWVIARTHPASILGAFLTERIVENGRILISLSALAGRGAKAWAGALEDRMAAYATEQKCAAVVFAGSQAWGRLLPQCRVIGRHESGQPLYERAAA